MTGVTGVQCGAAKGNRTLRGDVLGRLVSSDVASCEDAKGVCIPPTVLAAGRHGRSLHPTGNRVPFLRVGLVCYELMLPHQPFLPAAQVSRT